VPAETSARAPYGSGIYTAGWTERTYSELLRRAAVLLDHGESVIADASFISAQQRGAAAATATEASADLVQLCCPAPREMAAQRITARPSRVPDADEAIAATMGAAAEPWPEATVIGTEADGVAGMTDEPVNRALEAIRPHGPKHVWRPGRPYMLPG
jgi:uncharacterized protein